MYIPILRKKQNVVNEIKKIDKDTAISQYLIETLVKKNFISKVNYGNALLINLDESIFIFSSLQSISLFAISAILLNIDLS